MSKKKASTMTLRDFHGGNIPSDLPLPSAPGMLVERKSHDRPGSGGWMGSSLHRGYSGERVGFSRQGSGTFARSYEEKMSYLPNSANIGRNYDEDERKPVDGHSHRGQSSEFYEEAIYEPRQVAHERPPERNVLDNRGGVRENYLQEESSLASVSSSMFRVDSSSRHASMYQDSSSQPFVSQEHTGHYSRHVPPVSPYHSQEAGQPWRQSSFGQQRVTPGTLMGTGTGVQNVWTARKDVEYGRSYPAEYVVNDSASVHTSGSRIAQASALEKVSSGKWNSRTIQSPTDSQVYTGDYGQSNSGPYEGGNVYTSRDNTRSPADYEQAAYTDRSAYSEPSRGVDSLSVRDSRLYTEKVNLQDSRLEQFAEGRVASQSEHIWYMDDRRSYGEIGQKRNGTQREAVIFLGSGDGAHLESGQSSVTSNQSKTNDSELRSSLQGNLGQIWPQHSSRREYGEVLHAETNKALSSEFEKRGYSSGESFLDRDCGLLHRPHVSENPKEYSLYSDNSYHTAGKDDLGHLNASNPKSQEDFSREVSNSNRIGHFHDRGRGLDIDQNHPGRLLSPGSVRTSSHESVGAAINLTGDEGKGTLIERPKLKLLPRSRPLHINSLEDIVPEHSQEDLEITGLSHAEGTPDSGSGTSGPLIIAVGEEPLRTVERPKLSLKPRSQPVDVSPAGSGSVKERMSLFGGARPRELVLKERGVDESVIVGTDLTSSASPSTMSGIRTPLEGNRTTPGSLGYGLEKPEKQDERNRRIDQHETRTGRQDSGRLERLDSRGRRDHIDFDKKDERRSEYLHHPEKRDSERPDVDKQESWRRPVEVQQSPVPGGEGSSGGSGRPIQSAAELAQAFSRSTSFGSGPSTSAQGYASQRSPGPRMPGLISGMGSETPGLRNNVPFSRLTEAVSPGPRDVHVSGVQGHHHTSAF